MKALALALLLFAIPAAAEPALTLPLTAPPGAGPMRLELPAEVLAASRSDGLADLRLLDSTGRRLPMARLEQAPVTAATRHALVPVPVLGRAGTLEQARLKLTVDPGTGLRVAEIEGALADGPTVALAHLLDTRALSGAATRLMLEGDIPANQPVRVRVDASEDLATWRQLGERTLFRTGAGAALEPVSLDGTEVKGRYLRLRFETETPPLAPIALRGATLETGTTSAPALRTAAVPAAAVGQGKAFVIALPAALPLQALTLRPAEPGLVVPVRILGRDAPDAPWLLLGEGAALHLDAAGAAPAPIPLAPGPTRQLKVQAVEPGEGFPTPPAVELGFAPVTLLVVASGNPPYRLAVGEAGAETAFLPLPALTPALGGKDIAALPTALLPDRPATVVATRLAGEGPAPRTLWLWAALILGTLSLAAMAWKLLRG